MVGCVRIEGVNTIALSLLSLVGLAASVLAAEAKKPVEKPAAGMERVTFGGGCFWCLEAVFQRLKGVEKVVSGYAGGHVAKPTYKQVCTGETGHAEVVQIVFNPAQLPLEKLLEVFWAAHDPTTLNRQGGDVGTQYRSVIYFETPAQKAAAEASKAAAQKDFSAPIVTEITVLDRFYAAEDYHQNYYNLNAGANPYCSVVIRPKLQKLLQKGLIKDQ